MQESDIRAALDRRLRRADSAAFVIHELGICEGGSRIDIATVADLLSGYEIKSAADCLKRLPRQIEAYSRVFDVINIVVDSKHVEDVVRLCPSWWGVIEVCEHRATPVFSVVRGFGSNPEVDGFSVAQLLWRDEALSLLRTLGAEKGVLSKPREFVWRRLCETLSVSDLSNHVRDVLRTRRKWRS